jgi:hypothetical protein
MYMYNILNVHLEVHLEVHFRPGKDQNQDNNNTPLRKRLLSTLESGEGVRKSEERRGHSVTAPQWLHTSD